MNILTKWLNIELVPVAKIENLVRSLFA